MAGLPAGSGVRARLEVGARDPIGEVGRGPFVALKAETAIPVPPSADPTGPFEPSAGMSAKRILRARKPSAA